MILRNSFLRVNEFLSIFQIIYDNLKYIDKLRIKGDRINIIIGQFSLLV